MTMDMVYEQFKQWTCNTAPIGLEREGAFFPYYCTPKDAQIIGQAGVDGIHYCTIPQFADMIFAVSPMNFGDCVHPIARNFEDLLRMLLYCADMAALEQCYAWEEEQFKAFLLDCPATEEQQRVLDAIAREFDLTPMEECFAYIKQLQREFDLSQIPYTENDETLHMAEPVQQEDWNVTYEGGFQSRAGKTGTEIATETWFHWGKEKWYIPAVYLCDEGLVADYFMEVDPTAVKAILDQWELLNEAGRSEQQEQLSRANPLNVRFHGYMICNGQELQEDHGMGESWVPASCLPRGEGNSEKTKRILEHYGLDIHQAWLIYRTCYHWNGEDRPVVQSLCVRMEREPEQFMGSVFVTPPAGKHVTLLHPVTGREHTLTIHEIEQQNMQEDMLANPYVEHPAWFTMLSYSLEPDLASRNFILQDCAQADAPRLREETASAVGIIGGSDGPIAYLVTGKAAPALHVACSSLHYEPVEQIKWRTVFYEKTMDDVCVSLI